MAQHNAYQPLRSVGGLPGDFTLKAPTVPAENSGILDRLRTKSQRRDMALSAFLVQRLLTSGSVVYGDSVTNYLNQIADRLLAEKTELRNKIRIYTLKSIHGEIITTHTGIVMVPLQLIAQTENEAQLAYLMAIEFTRIERNLFDYSQAFPNFAISHPDLEDMGSRYIEIGSTPVPYIRGLTCDSLGYFLSRDAGYDADAALRAVDVLQWSQQPFMNVDFRPDFFEFDSIRFPKAHLLANPRVLFDDAVSKQEVRFRERRELLHNLVVTDKKQEGKRFPQGKNEFLRVKQIAQFETILLELSETNFTRAFYDCYSLNTVYPQHPFLEEASCKALYGLAKYKNANKIQYTDLDSKAAYDNFERCAYFFETLSSEQLTVFSIRYLFNYTEKYTNPFITKLLHDLIAQGIEQRNIDFQLLNSAIQNADLGLSMPVVRTETKITAEDSISDDSKFDRLRKIKKEGLADEREANNGSEPDAYLRKNIQYLAFRHVNIQRFNAHYTSSADMLKAKRARRQRNDEMYSNKGGKKNTAGMDSLIFVNPTNLEFTRRNNVQPKKSHRKTKELLESVNSCAIAAGMTSLLSTNYYEVATNADEYNVNSVLFEFTNEALLHTIHNVEMISLQGQYAQEEASTSGIRHCCIVNSQHKKGFRTANTYIGTLLAFPINFAFPFVSPIGLSIAFTKAHRTQLNLIYFDVENAELMYSQSIDIKYKNSMGMLKSLLYDSLRKVKSTRD